MSAAHSALNRSAAIASISMASVLLGLKGWGAYATGSTAMLGSLADTALDLVSSIATLAGVWIAGLPDDDNHRFGHGKAEAISALLQVVLIAVSAVGLMGHAGTELVAGTHTADAGTGVIVSAVAIVGTLGLLAWQRHVIRQTASIAISTDHLHYKADLVMNVAVIAALVLDQLAGWHWADAVFGIAIALWLGWGAWEASTQAVDQLMDHEWPDDMKNRFLEVLARHPEIEGIHDLRTRTAGNRHFVQFHVWMDGRMSVAEAHDVMDEIEAKILSEFPDIEVLIHPDPTGHVDESGVAAEDVLAGVVGRE